MLERRIVDLGLGDHVQFDDRFLSIEELADLLAATDVFVTPYTNSEQSSSGALTFALAAGCAVVSTPFLYADDMLRSGAGMIVPFADPAALADAVCALIEHPEQLAAARAEARRVGSGLAWPSVAEATAAVLEEAAVAAPRRTPMPDVGLELADARTDHLLTLVDDCGIIQHARGAIPNRYTGYCVDDIARLVVVALELESRTGDSVWTPVLGRSLAFLYDADRFGRRRHAQLHELRPQLARRAACRRPRRPVDLGARRRPLDRVGARRRRTVPATARGARPLARRRARDSHRRVRDARPRATRRRPARRRRATSARALRDAARGCVRGELR